MILEFPQFAYDILSMVLDQKEKSVKEKGKEDKDDGDGKGSERIKSGRKRPRVSTFSWLIDVMVELLNYSGSEYVFIVEGSLGIIKEG